MKKLKILIGCSGAGKSTYAKEQFKKNPTETIIIGRDKIRELLYGYIEETVCEYYSRNDFNYLESQVTATQDNLINFWLKKEKTVIVDNTHLKQSYINDYDKFGVEVEIIYFDVLLKEALTRDMCRNRKVGEDIINRQYSQYINLLNSEKQLKTEKEMIEKLIEIAKLGDSTYLIQKLELIEKTLLENKNDFTLGAKLRKLLS